MDHYEFFEHTADVGFRARGSTLESALSAACAALTDVMTGGATAELRREMAFEVPAMDPQQLVVDLLSHLVYLADADGFITGRCDITLQNGWNASVVARGESFNPDRHGEGLEVKAVAYHMLRVEQQGSGQWLIQVLLDV